MALMVPVESQHHLRTSPTNLLVRGSKQSRSPVMGSFPVVHMQTSKKTKFIQGVFKPKPEFVLGTRTCFTLTAWSHLSFAEREKAEHDSTFACAALEQAYSGNRKVLIGRYSGGIRARQRKCDMHETGASFGWFVMVIHLSIWPKLSDLFKFKLQEEKRAHPQHKNALWRPERNAESPLGQTSDVHLAFLIKTGCKTSMLLYKNLRSSTKLDCFFSSHMNEEVYLWGLSSVSSSRLYLNILPWLVSADTVNLHVCWCASWGASQKEEEIEPDVLLWQIRQGGVKPGDSEHVTGSLQWEVVGEWLTC